MDTRGIFTSRGPPGKSDKRSERAEGPANAGPSDRRSVGSYPLAVTIVGVPIGPVAVPV